VSGSTLASCASGGGGTSPAAAAAVPSLGPGQSAVVTYCNGQRARITEPERLDGPAPAAIYVHGGSWVSGNYDTGGFLIDEIGPALERAGFVVASVDYRLGPAAPWPDQIIDVKCAVRYLRANAKALHVDPGAIAAWGQSAGGHLVSLLATAGPQAGWDTGAYPGVSSAIDAVVDMAGPSDLLTLGNAGDSGVVQDSFISLLGNVAPSRLGLALQDASPVTYVAPGDPPFLIFQADNDEIVYPRQSQDLTWDLAAAGVPVTLVVVHGGGHELDQPGGSPDPAQITSMVVAFLVKTLHVHPSH